jgi:hypothetical protein
MATMTIHHRSVSANEQHVFHVELPHLKAACAVLGDESKGGRIRPKKIYVETLPIPDVSTLEQEEIGSLAQQAQRLHSDWRKRVERFLLAFGISAAASSGRNPLEQR